MEFFILSIEHEKQKILIFARDENRNKCIIEYFQPFYVYVIPKGEYFEEVKRKIEELNINKEVSVERKKWIGREYRVLKVTISLDDYETLKSLCDRLKEEGKIIGKKEADITITKKFSLDNNVYPMRWYEMEVEFKGKMGNANLYKLKRVIREVEKPYEIKAISIDIEILAGGRKMPDPSRDPIDIIGIFDGKDYYILYWGAEGNGGIKVRNEYELLKKFDEIVKKIDPDVIVGYNSHNFDLNYIYERSKVLNFNFSFGWDGKGIVLSKKKEEDRRFKIFGIQHVDLFVFISNILAGQLKSEVLSLDNVAKEILGIGKEEVTLETFRDAVDLKEYSKVISYNKRDVEITYMLYKHFEQLLIELSKITGQTLYETSLSTYGVLVESYLIKRSREFNEIIPNRPKEEEARERLRKSYIGALVLEPEPGLYKNIAVFDFRSLYPSIIMAYNISPDTIRCEHEDCKKEQITIETSDGKVPIWFCKKEKGFIPTILNQIFEERVKIKKKLKELDKNSEEYRIMDARQYALKILLNSTYGYLGFAVSRWYCLDCAAAVTAYGRTFIKKVIDLLRDKGYKVIYGDTDSVFVLLRSKEDIKILDEINNILPKPLELELENFYISGIFVERRGEVKGAKKKYALLSEDGSIKLRGFEAVRRDWSEIAKVVQENVLRLALEGNRTGIIEYLRKIINDIRSKKLSLNMFIIREQLRKKLEKYEVEAPHVVAAKKYKQRGYKITEGFIVEYVVCKGSGKVSERIKIPEECTNNEYDPEYYIEKQVLQPIDGILKVLGITKEQIISGHKDILSFFK
ncbi:MAG: hypothetical protein BXU00_02090 [Candidatus Nanoclepta minutus]|uniref:DNA polymerase n=1 Tax=Candidatus Nanoclepta minutus TaxID=1940235 RepID=A0A397WMM3_9ARCH|nr:MAG: hypothetical protein BXU00_02090 [Candidatus Nanoclepta minutus]